jgi:iron complex outermembrane receptor protein
MDSKISRLLAVGSPAILTVFSAQNALAEDFDALSLEELLNVEVTSVSKSSERMQDVATSIYVLNSEDIQRSGATRLTDLLKLVPGTWFSEMSFTNATSGVREQAQSYSQSVLVIQDGVPLTSPITAGMDWAGSDIALDEIESIEVIKGPGGTIYGANAVTGIINITTRSAKVEGLSLRVEGGNLGYASPKLAWGKTLGNGHISLWAKHRSHDGYGKGDFEGSTLNVTAPDGSPASIDNAFAWDEGNHLTSLTGGLRFEQKLTPGLSMEGGLYLRDNTENTWASNAIPFPESYEELLAMGAAGLTPGGVQHYTMEARNDRQTAFSRFDWQPVDGHNVFVNGYLTRSSTYSSAAGGYGATVLQGETELQDNFAVGERHAFNVGFNARQVRYDIETGDRTELYFTEASSHKNLFGGFAQDRITITPELDVTMGLKAEVWTLVSDKANLMPSARFSWRPEERTTFWGAASRSYTTPGLIQTSIEVQVAQMPSAFMYGAGLIPGWDPNTMGIPPIAGMKAAIVNGADIRPSSFDTFELGTRKTLNEHVSVDISTFYVLSDDRVSASGIDMTAPIESSWHPGTYILPLYYQNMEKGTLYGSETVLKVVATGNLRFEASHSWLVSSLESTTDGSDRTPDTPGTPEHVLRLRSYFDLPESGWKFTVNTTWATEHERGSAYDYYNLAWADANEANGNNILLKDEAASRLQLDGSVLKSFQGLPLTVQLWGRNLLADGYIDYADPYAFTAFPRQVERQFGVNLNYSF